MPTHVTTITEKKDLQILRMRAAKGARLNAQVWQGLASTERLRGDDVAAVVEVVTGDDTVVVCTWDNWRVLMEHIDLLEKDVAMLKGDDA